MGEAFSDHRTLEEDDRRPQRPTVSALDFDAWLGAQPAAAGLLGPDGRVRAANREFRMLLGVAPHASLVGCHLRELAPDLWPRLGPLVRWTALTGARAADISLQHQDPAAATGIRRWLIRLAPSNVAGTHTLRLLILDLTDADTQGPMPPRETGETEPALTLRLPADPAELTRLRHLLEQWLATLGANEEERSDIVLAAHEAATNAIQHGAHDEDEIVVGAEARAGCVMVRVEDEGHWEPAAPIGLEGDARRGLALMQLLMDDVSVHTGAEGTHVRMQRRLGWRRSKGGASR